jgi:hypothetical protein
MGPKDEEEKEGAEEKEDEGDEEAEKRPAPARQAARLTTRSRLFTDDLPLRGDRFLKLASPAFLGQARF